MEEWVICGLVAAWMFFSAYITGVKKNLTHLHGYHIKNVRAEDIPAMANRLALCFLFCGLDITFLCFTDTILKNEVCTGVGIAVLLVIVLVMALIIRRYNGSVFGFKKPRS